jgi:hypothetical protein
VETSPEVVTGAEDSPVVGATLAVSPLGAVILVLVETTLVATGAVPGELVDGAVVAEFTLGLGGTGVTTGALDAEAGVVAVGPTSAAGEPPQPQTLTSGEHTVIRRNEPNQSRVFEIIGVRSVDDCDDTRQIFPRHLRVVRSHPIFPLTLRLRDPAF